MPQINEPEDESQIDRRHWGELGSEEEESDQESELDDEEEAETVPTATRTADAGYVTPAPTDAGTATPSGVSTVLGLETPDTMELRKKRVEERYFLDEF